MSEWKEYKLGDVCVRLSSGKGISLKDTSTVGAFPIFGGNGTRGYSHKNNFEGECAIIGRQGAYCGNVRYFKGKAYMTEHAIIMIANAENNTRFLSYFLSLQNLGNLSAQSAQPGISVKTLSEQKYLLPSLDEQERIVGILSSLDDKIDLLNRQNATLEKMAETLFRKWFIEDVKEDWKEGVLTDVADFLNGLVCQKVSAQNAIKKLPVLKIRELNCGITSDTDWTTSDIAPEYIIESGDVIFAWSASLMVKIWNGEKCILNQHLFKVTSDIFPKWFYFMWCKYHLEEFKMIATSHATTMGHIKRKDLDSAKVIIPTQNRLDEMTEKMQPLIDKIICNNNQIRTLTRLRDTLLPKLMNGEITVE